MEKIGFLYLLCAVLAFAPLPASAQWDDERDDTEWNRKFDDMREQSRNANQRIFDNSMQDDRLKYQKDRGGHELKNEFAKPNGDRQSIGSIISNQLEPSSGR